MYKLDFLPESFLWGDRKPVWDWLNCLATLKSVNLPRLYFGVWYPMYQDNLIFTGEVISNCIILGSFVFLTAASTTHLLHWVCLFIYSFIRASCIQSTVSHCLARRYTDVDCALKRLKRIPIWTWDEDMYTNNYGAWQKMLNAWDECTVSTMKVWKEKRCLRLSRSPACCLLHILDGKWHISVMQKMVDSPIRACTYTQVC